MKSIAFPKMFNSNSTNSVTDYEASKQNLILLFNSERGQLFGDPAFGIKLKKFLYEQNNFILKEVLIDEIYTQSALFAPQYRVNRNDIDIIADKAKLYIRFKAINQANYKTDMFNLQLFNADEQQ